MASERDRFFSSDIPPHSFLEDDAQTRGQRFPIKQHVPGKTIVGIYGIALRKAMVFLEHCLDNGEIGYSAYLFGRPEDITKLWAKLKTIHGTFLTGGVIQERDFIELLATGVPEKLTPIFAQGDNQQVDSFIKEFKTYSPATQESIPFKLEQSAINLLMTDAQRAAYEESKLPPPGCRCSIS